MNKSKKHHWIKANLDRGEKKKLREALVNQLKVALKQGIILKIASTVGVYPLDVIPPIVEEVNRVIDEKKELVKNNYRDFGKGALIVKVEQNEKMEIVGESDYLELNRIETKKLFSQRMNTYFLDCLLFEITNDYEPDVEIPVILADSIGVNSSREFCIYLFCHRFNPKLTDAI